MRLYISFFFGKNKVMQVALGKTSDDEVAPGLHEVSECLLGDCGVMFSNQPLDEVLGYDV